MKYFLRRWKNHEVFATHAMAIDLVLRMTVRRVPSEARARAQAGEARMHEWVFGRSDDQWRQRKSTTA
jgi:predicted secreted hydrolase